MTTPGSERKPYRFLPAVLSLFLVLPIAIAVGAFTGWCLGSAAGEWLGWLGLKNAVVQGGTIGGLLGAVFCVGRLAITSLRDREDTRKDGTL